jgi:hypothetical protein
MATVQSSSNACPCASKAQPILLGAVRRRPDFVGFRAGEPEQPPALADAAKVNGHGPVVEQILAEHHFVAEVVIHLCVVSFKYHGNQIVHDPFPDGTSLIALLSRKRLNRNVPTADLPLELH